MIKILEEAIEKVKALPEEKQRYAARILEELADDAVYQLSDEEERLVQEGIDDADAGRVLSEAQTAEFWNRHQA